MIRRVLLALLVFGLVACGVDVTDPGSVSGTYTLRSINGDPLPVVIGPSEITAGSLTLNEDLTCSISITARVTEDGIVTTETETEMCSYTLDSGSITYTTSTGVASGLISDDFTIAIFTLVGVFVFKK